MRKTSSVAAFEKFAALNEERLSADTITTYRSVWNQWTEWLAGEEISWDSADDGAVRRFLISRKARANGSRTVSDVTKRRYWRILRDVYQTDAAANSDEAQQQRFPKAWSVGAKQPEMTAKSMLFRGRDMARIRAVLEADIAQLEAAGQTAPWTQLRDAALLAVLLSTAAKVSELHHLHDNDFSEHKPGSSESGGREIRYVILKSTRTLRTSDSKSVPARALELDPLARRAMRIWNAYREESGLRQHHSPVFVRAAGRSGPSYDPLSAVSMFHRVADFVARAIPTRSENFHHIGPESLRNSVIKEWMDAKRPEQQILDDAGVRDSKILRRLERAA